MKISLIFWLKTTIEVWDALEHRFGQSSSARLFHIEKELSKIVQTTNMTIEEFYTKIKGGWDELDALDPIAACSCNGCECELTKKAKKSQQSRRLVQFLMKLNNKHHQTTSNILMVKPIPTVAEAYGVLLQEQVHQVISNGTNLE